MGSLRVLCIGFDRGGRTVSGQMEGNRGFVRPMPMSDAAFEKIVKLTQAKRLMDEKTKVPCVVGDTVEVRGKKRKSRFNLADL